MNKTTLIAITSLVLAGCNTLGQSQPDCPKNNQGAACLSAREIFERTHVADSVQPNFKDGKEIKPSSSNSDASAASSMQVVASASGHPPPPPEVDSPLPIRTPAKVMRIRIFPWEDNSRDLHSGGFVFTEVEGRTWSIGEEQVSRVQANVISPLTPPSRVTGGTNLSPLNVTGAQAPATPGRQVPPGHPTQGARTGQGQTAPLNSLNPK